MDQQDITFYRWYEEDSLKEILRDYICQYDIMRSIFSLSSRSINLYNSIELDEIYPRIALNPCGFEKVFFCWMVHYISESLKLMIEDYKFDEDSDYIPYRTSMIFDSKLNDHIPVDFTINFSNVSIAKYILDNLERIEYEDIILKFYPQDRIGDIIFDIILDFGDEICMVFRVNNKSLSIIQNKYILKLPYNFINSLFTEQDLSDFYSKISGVNSDYFISEISDSNPNIKKYTDR